MSEKNRQESWDVFVSYSREDEAWVKRLAQNLHRQGLDVFWDRWEIGVGDAWLKRLETGLEKSGVGLLVVTPAAMSSDFVRAEYEVLVRDAIVGKRSIIPIIRKTADVPAFLGSIQWIDFRADTEYGARFDELVAAVEGKRPARPERDGGFEIPRDSSIRMAAPIEMRLAVSLDEIALYEEGAEIARTPRGPIAANLETLHYELERQRHRTIPEEEQRPSRDDGSAGASPSHALQLEIGEALTTAFLPGEVGQAVRSAVARARSHNSTLRFALQIDEELRGLAWETLRVTGETDDIADGPLALDRNVDLHRFVDTGEAAPAIQIPGPLRVLVVIGSPDNTENSLLDMEAELERILDAVEPTRRSRKAYVRILENGTVKGIRDALVEQQFHVLHVSCHAGPGVLILEDDAGNEDRVDCETFRTKAIPPNRTPPLVVLAGCATGASGIEKKSAEQKSEEESKKEARVIPSFARDLLEAGVPSVVAMQAPVGDRYATLLAGSLYQELAMMPQPDPLTALSVARRAVEVKRGSEQNVKNRVILSEWGTPAIYLRGPSPVLLDSSAAFEEIEEADAPRHAEGVVVRGVGQFVGRRREKRRVLNALTGGKSAGCVIHGMGGVGKSTLAAEACRLMGESRHVLVSVFGPTSVSDVFNAFSNRLLALGTATGGESGQALLQLGQMLSTPGYDWQQKWQLLSELLLDKVGLVFLFDNFEDNLTAEDESVPEALTVHDPELAELLSRWAQRPGHSRLVFTCRYSFTLPDDAQRSLQPLHLGPLSLAETRKLIWRLPALESMSQKDVRKAYSTVGGHPRALEYLDALLRGGVARFDDVRTRIEGILKKRGVNDAATWWSDTGPDLDAALAETITLAADDVLLAGLLERLGSDSLATRLLEGASVYRTPVDDVGLAWQVGEISEIEADPERDARLEKFAVACNEVSANDKAVNPANLGISEEEFQARMREYFELQRPPVLAPDGFQSAAETLLDWGLLSVVPSAQDRQQFIVHRWTAEALAKAMSSDRIRACNATASGYWEWRVDRAAQSPAADLEDRLEAAFHARNAGHLDDYLNQTYRAADRLDDWGEWRRASSLLESALKLASGFTAHQARFTHLLGILSQNQGAYQDALQWYTKSLAIAEELDDRAGMARTYHQLGNLDFQRGAYDDALGWYRKSLDIQEKLDDRAGMAKVYHQLGMVDFQRGAYDDALDWYTKSLAIKEELGNRASLASSYHQLGNLDFQRGSHDDALGWYRKSLAIAEEIGDRAGMAKIYHQLAMVDQQRGAYRDALGWYRKSLAIHEELGDRAGMAKTYHQLGNLDFQRSAYDDALGWYSKSLAIEQELGNRAGLASSFHQLGNVDHQRGAYDDALAWYMKSLAIAEELGNRVGVAATASQVGLLLSSQERHREALSWSLRAMSIRHSIKAASVVDANALLECRKQLGASEFARALAEEGLDPESTKILLEILDGLDDERDGAIDSAEA